MSYRNGRKSRATHAIAPEPPLCHRVRRGSAAPFAV